MPPVFGRSSLPLHSYDTCLGELLHSVEAYNRAMARNLMHDHRVSVARVQVFDKFVSSPCTPSSLNHGVVRYYTENVLTRHLPDYVYKRLNGENLLSGDPLGTHVIHKDALLARVVDLTGLGHLYGWAKSRGMRAFSRYPERAPESTWVQDWLDERLLGRSAPRVQDFLGSVFEMLNTYRRDFPYQPSWATTWSALSPHLSSPPERWLEVLGIDKAVAPRWLIVLKYSVREAGTIARPTQLDAGWRSFHFPSPPCATPYNGGHPMDLSIPSRAAGLLPEFIHKQIDHDITHWTSAGSICKKTDNPSPEALIEQRLNHHKLLVRMYGSMEVLSWMSGGI